MHRQASPWTWFGAAPLVLFLLIPPLALALRGSAAIGPALHSEDTWSAVGVSMRTSFVSLGLLILFGTPLAWLLARTRSLPVRAIDVLVDFPLVLPPAAAGIALLLAFGRKGLVPTGMPFTAAAVVAAQSFVAAPLYVRSAVAAFRALPADALEVARLEGAGGWTGFARIVLPLSVGTMASGAMMAWARALGEFGATILFAGSLMGRTETLPLAIYIGFETDLDQAIGLALLLLLLAAVVLGAAKLLSKSTSPA